MTTVAFVTYKFGDLERQVGPITLDKAQTAAKELCRRPMVTDVSVQEWALLRSWKVESPA